MRRPINALLVIASLLGLAACQAANSARDATFGNFERAADLGLDPAQPPNPPDRADFAEVWMAKSDILCRKYKDTIISASINSRLGSDLASAVLSTLATIFTPVNTVRGLAGAAAVATGVGAVVQSDAFQSQSGQIIAAAIQTARQNQANQIEINLRKLGETDYSVYRAQRDVIEYHNMCSLETALGQVQSSLKLTSPDGGLSPPAKQGAQTPGGPPPDKITLTSGTSEVKPLTPLRQPIAGAMGRAEQSLPASDGRRIEAALCLVPDTGTVTFGPPFRAAVAMFRATEGGNRPSLTGGLLGDEASRLSTTAACNRALYDNAFEAFEFPSPATIRALQQQLASVAPPDKPVAPGDGTFGPETRTAIKAIQEQRCQIPTGQITPTFLDSLVDPPPRNGCPAH